ncbi:MAG: hypothetical protein ABH864_06480 [archaeon]
MKEYYSFKKNPEEYQPYWTLKMDEIIDYVRKKNIEDEYNSIK